MRAPSSRTRKIAGFAAGPLAIVAAGAMVWQGSSAAFTSSTNNAGNNWATGQIALTNDDNSGAATFTAKGLVPGAKGTKCITLTATSSVDVSSSIYASVSDLAAGASASQDFNDTLSLTMKYATPAANTTVTTDCANFPTAGSTDVFTGSLSALATQTASTPAPAGTIAEATTAGTPDGTKIVYKVDYVFNPSGLSQDRQNALMNKTAGAKLVWELKAGV